MAKRPGETSDTAFLLDVVRKEHPRPDGTTAVELGVQLGDVPVPDRQYFADIANVDISGGFARLLFGQRKIGQGLRSLVIISLARTEAAAFLQSCRDYLPKAEKFLSDLKIEKTPLTEVAEEPDQTVSMLANIVAAAHSGEEACLDFYLSSARSKFLVVRNQASRLAVEPVVRIHLATALVVPLIERLFLRLEST